MQTINLAEGFKFDFTKTIKVIWVSNSTLSMGKQVLVTLMCHGKVERASAS